jgi:serine/threonine-protein kinase
MPASVPNLPHSIGRYEVEKRLGQGAMGRVLLAHDPVLDRHVAIKLLRDDLGLPGEQQHQLFRRMRQEARASARVSHPNIVALFDMGEDETCGLFLVFEYVHGNTLKHRIAQAPIDHAAVARIAYELGEALTTAHAAGVLHRDIKPENVILAPTGAKIADFGIARLPESTLTRDGRLLGTPAYSSPESISHGTFSAASDQFSLAASMYEALSRMRAFPGDDAVQVATLITTTTAAPIANHCGCDRVVDSILQRAMNRNPEARFASCAEFGRELANALGLVPSLNGAALAATSHASTALRDQDVGGRTLRIVAGAGTLGALLMALVLHLGRGCQPGAAPVADLDDDAGVLPQSRPTPPASITRKPTRAIPPSRAVDGSKAASTEPSTRSAAGN